MTADPYEQARRPVARHIRETSEQLGGRPALADSLARDHYSPTTQAVAPD
jgi:hypothetical protein